MRLTLNALLRLLNINNSISITNKGFSSFEPSLRKTPERYEQHSELLPKVVRSLFPSIIKNEKPLFVIEMLLLMFNKRNKALYYVC